MKTFFSLSLVFLFSIGKTCIAQKPNFSGVWILNVDNTDFGSTSENSTPFRIVVSQKKDTFSITRSSHNSQGTMSAYSENLPVNGNPIYMTIKTTRKTEIFKYGIQDSAIHIEMTYVDDQAPEDYKHRRGFERWSLSQNGQELSIKRTDSLQNLSETRIIIYDKR